RLHRASLAAPRALAAPGAQARRPRPGRSGRAVPERRTGHPRGGPFQHITGGVLLSRALAGQVPSALRGLTALFGMGRGVSPSPKPPERGESTSPRALKTAQRPTFITGIGRSKEIRQALDPLVPVSFGHCCTSRSGLSTWWST